MILDKTLLLKGLAGVAAAGGSTGVYIYREELGLVSSSKMEEREAIEKAMIEKLDKARNEFLEWLPNGIAWTDLVGFMEKKENKDFFHNLSSTTTIDSSNYGKIEELLKFLKEFQCALEEHNVDNVLMFNVPILNKLICLIEELNNNKTLSKEKISHLKKLFDSVLKELKEINNVPTFS